MLDNTGFSLRERRGFEALDAGLHLYRKHFPGIQLAWLPLFLPLLVGGLFVPYQLLWIPPLVLWWIRPFWERLILRRVAHIFFNSGGKAPWKGVFRGILSDLTWRRFSLWRHYAQPPRSLEGLKRKRLRTRIRFLFNEYRGTAIALNVTMFSLELVFIIGVIAFASNMNNFIPHVLRKELTFQVAGAYQVLIIAWGLVSAITVPATVSMGFSLYINRRITIEGWDLEISFKRRAMQLKSMLAILLVAIFLGIGPGIPSAGAEEPPLESLDEILESDDFGDEISRTGWRWKDNGIDREPRESNNRMLNDLFGKGWETVASLLRILIISAVVFVVGMIIWKNRHVIFGLLPDTGSGRLKRSGPTKITEGKHPVLPALDMAQSLYEAGEIREAWSVLYRHLILYVDRQIADSPGESATEGEWLKIIRNQKTIDTEPAIALVNEWRRTAYAHRAPGADYFFRSLQDLKQIILSPQETDV